jgi:Alpha/beta hydrolase family
VEPRAFQTSTGTVVLWSDPATFEGSGPIVFAIRGAMAGLQDLEWLSETVPNVVYTHLPGFHSPFLRDTSIAAFIHAYDAAIAEMFGSRPVTVLGVSAGALVAAGLTSTQITGRLMIEPFFSTANLWALVELVRAALPLVLGRTWDLIVKRRRPPIWLPASQERQAHRNRGRCPASASAADVDLAESDNRR